MTNSNFNEVINKQIKICKSLLEVKGEEYDADSKDRLHSFKVAAALQSTTPLKALAGMLAKHIVSIYDMCESGDGSIEKWTEKISDSINYLLLLKAMICEDKMEKSDE